MKMVKILIWLNTNDINDIDGDIDDKDHHSKEDEDAFRIETLIQQEEKALLRHISSSSSSSSSSS